MLFIDSTYFIGLFVPNDNWQKRVDEIYIPNEEIVINNIVLSEVLNIVSKRSKIRVSEVIISLKKILK